jgi:hypothetical protein
MSIKKTIEIEAIAKDAVQQIQALTKKVEGLEDSLKNAGKETKKTNKILGGLSNLLKGGLGVAAIAKAFDLLKETFESNQKVADAFAIATEGLSLAFNDLFNFLDRNVGTVIDYFKGIFNDPQQAIKDFGDSIKRNIQERFESYLDTLGYLASAVKKVFSGDFAGAMEDVKSAGKESLDVLTGVNNSFDKATEVVDNVTKSVTEYAKSTFQAAKENVELQKTAELGIAQNRIILEQKDREAEKLRQIRDDESKTIDERIEANNKLAAVLDEQERLMLANADALIASAQAQYDKNKNQENEIALLEAKAEREGILAQIEGFRSEQLMNVNSLNREKLDLLDEEKEKEIEAAELRAKLKQEEREGIKDNLDAIIDSAGQESAIGKAVFVAKQAMLVKEQIAEAKATLAKITMKAADSGVALAQGTAETAKIGFPQNIPMLIGFAAQAAGIYSSIKSAVGAAKSSTSKFGSAGGSIPSLGGGSSRASVPVPSQAPAFNVVGASPENQLAQAMGEQERQPMKAYVVSNEVTNAQALDRNIVESASLG